ncbi:NAD(P)/FAD-dependent oxidoreductase [Halobacillus litoralis]|uniref:phytoene desaturase family protein n=1 Tax=Halobacillus litoralis TaxID=45668 RepID=UPI001CD3D641|nr:NAD(P)/FAD-dependent oxidoreductase [Halobacillus litoralis]MCA0971130.1 NAD(P)/FAD-dependent oxidoreductase [Halobacillus litoralis]
MVYDVAIVGAGFGGLAASAELSKHGKNVAVFEASNELGGSAGKYERNGYRFQSGATVGMGFEAGGVFDKLYHSLQIEKPPMTLLNPIMDIHMPDRVIHYFKEKQEWYKEIERHFPEAASPIQAFYDEVFYVGSLVDQLLDYRPVFPPKTIKDWTRLLPMVNTSSLRLLPYMNQTVYDRLKKYKLHQHERFQTFLNGELMDSVQTSVEYCPAFLGYAALQTFHKGAYAVHGGLATVAEQLAGYVEDKGNEVFMRYPIRRIEKKGGHFILHSKRNSQFEAKQLILNHSVHNLADTLTEDLMKQTTIKQEKEEQRETWGAFIIHAGVDASVFDGTDVLYHQFIDPEHPNDLHDGGQFLMSLSDAEDTQMAPEGKRSLTISTHTNLEQWWEAEDYETKKQEMTDRLIATVDHYFPGFEAGLDLVLPGTPVTFQKWLRRSKGKVGGYAPTGRYSWLNSYSVRSGIPGVYLCGDTVFPGAGTLGVTLSGLTAAREALR